MLCWCWCVCGVRLGLVRAEKVKGAMSHAWFNYKSRAWGADEVLPKTGGFKDVWGGKVTSTTRACACVWIAYLCVDCVFVCDRDGYDNSGCTGHTVDYGNAEGV